MVLLVSLVAPKCHRDTKRTIFPVPLGSDVIDHICGLYAHTLQYHKNTAGGFSI